MHILLLHIFPFVSNRTSSMLLFAQLIGCWVKARADTVDKIYEHLCHRTFAAKECLSRNTYCSVLL
jgi:hypothetical protein